MDRYRDLAYADRSMASMTVYKHTAVDAIVEPMMHFYIHHAYLVVVRMDLFLNQNKYRKTHSICCDLKLILKKLFFIQFRSAHYLELSKNLLDCRLIYNDQKTTVNKRLIDNNQFSHTDRGLGFH